MFTYYTEMIKCSESLYIREHLWSAFFIAYWFLNISTRRQVDIHFDSYITLFIRSAIFAFVCLPNRKILFFRFFFPFSSPVFALFPLQSQSPIRLLKHITCIKIALSRSHFQSRGKHLVFLDNSTMIFKCLNMPLKNRIQKWFA